MGSRIVGEIIFQNMTAGNHVGGVIQKTPVAIAAKISVHHIALVGDQPIEILNDGVAKIGFHHEDATGTAAVHHIASFLR